MGQHQADGAAEGAVSSIDSSEITRFGRRQLGPYFAQEVVELSSGEAPPCIENGGCVTIHADLAP